MTNEPELIKVVQINLCNYISIFFSYIQDECIIFVQLITLEEMHYIFIPGHFEPKPNTRLNKKYYFSVLISIIYIS